MPCTLFDGKCRHIDINKLNRNDDKLTAFEGCLQESCFTWVLEKLF
jgi:hypothetical protein